MTQPPHDDPFDSIPEGCSPFPFFLLHHPSRPKGRKYNTWPLVGGSICALAYQERLAGKGDGYTLTTTLKLIREHGGFTTKQVNDAVDWLVSIDKIQVIRIEPAPSDDSVINIKLLFRYSQEGGNG